LTSQNEAYNVEKAALIAELQLAGIKYTPEKIVRIAKTLDNKIVPDYEVVYFSEILQKNIDHPKELEALLSAS